MGSADPAPGQSDLAERLADPLTLGFVASDDGSFARVTAVTLRDGEESHVEVLVRGGDLTVALADGALRVESMEVTAADVTVGPGIMPPDGATLTGIAFALSAPMQTALAEETESAAFAAGDLPVAVRWSVVLEHGIVDLAPIRLPELPFEISLALAADGEVEAHLTASQAGPFWNWAGIFELRDLELELVAKTGQLGPGTVD
ncbi:MAG TPA: hypothetical protein VFU21_13715 [Kofleriaceae bacterium]|nr:hypothetical protein [Kofleriaceae bacterium]